MKVDLWSEIEGPDDTAGYCVFFLQKAHISLTAALSTDSAYSTRAVIWTHFRATA